MNGTEFAAALRNNFIDVTFDTDSFGNGTILFKGAMIYKISPQFFRACSDFTSMYNYIEQEIDKYIVENLS